jgi:hypothetical protein
MAPRVQYGRSMRTHLIAILLTVPALLTSGCTHSCTLVDCAIGNSSANLSAGEGAVIEVVNVASTLADHLPLSIDACVDGACGQLALKDEGGKPVCEVVEASAFPQSICGVNDAGTLTIVLAHEIPDDDASIHLTIKNTAGDMLFDKTATGSVNENAPNGAGCEPGCRAAIVQLEPAPASS